MGFSNFQIQLGHSPRLIPPLVPESLTPITTQPDETLCARKLIVDIQTDVDEAKDNLLQAKILLLTNTGHPNPLSKLGTR